MSRSCNRNNRVPIPEGIAFLLPGTGVVVPMDYISQENYPVHMKNLIGYHTGQYV